METEEGHTNVDKCCNHLFYLGELGRGGDI